MRGRVEPSVEVHAADFPRKNGGRQPLNRRPYLLYYSLSNIKIWLMGVIAKPLENPPRQNTHTHTIYIYIYISVLPQVNCSADACVFAVKLRCVVVRGAS